MSPKNIAELLAGTPYRHVRRLAQGGMAEVHVVSHRALGGELVMKLVHPGEPEAQAALSKRLLAEARILRRLRHPNIVEVSDFGFAEDGRAYLITELLRGKTLKEQLVDRGAPMDPEEAFHVLDHVLAGLDAAHEIGLVHRDLKPDNVFYLDAPAGEPRIAKILDFGIAKVVGDRASSIVGSAYGATQLGIMLGTPMYASPEQIACRAVDARADLYAAGGMLHFLLTLRPPFAATNAYEHLRAHIDDPATPPSLHRPDLEPEVDAFVLRALEKRPANRFASAREMRAALRALPRPASPTSSASSIAPALLAASETPTVSEPSPLRVFEAPTAPLPSVEALTSMLASAEDPEAERVGSSSPATELFDTTPMPSRVAATAAAPSTQLTGKGTVRMTPVSALEKSPVVRAQSPQAATRGTVRIATVPTAPLPNALPVHPIARPVRVERMEIPEQMLDVPRTSRRSGLAPRTRTIVQHALIGVVTALITMIVALTIARCVDGDRPAAFPSSKPGLVSAHWARPARMNKPAGYSLFLARVTFPVHLADLAPIAEVDGRRGYRLRSTRLTRGSRPHGRRLASTSFGIVP